MAMTQLSGDATHHYPKTHAEILDNLRVRFHRVYPNLPVPERSMPCIVLKISGRPEPLSWCVCKMEIDAKTRLSQRILYWLAKMEFI